MSAGGIGKLDPEDADGTQDDDDTYWFGSTGFEDEAWGKNSPGADFGGNLDMLASEGDHLNVPMREPTSPSLRPNDPPRLSPESGGAYYQTIGGPNQYDLGQQQQQQPPMQASGMQHVQQSHMHMPSSQGSSSHLVQSSGGQPIYVQQPAGSVPSSSNVQYSYMSNGSSWSSQQQQSQTQQQQQQSGGGQMPQQTVLVQSMNQLNGSAQYVIVNSQTSCANIVASGAQLMQQQSQRSVVMAGSSSSNVTTMSGQPIVSSQTMPEGSSGYSQEVLMPQQHGCISNSMPNGRIVINSQNQRLQTLDQSNSQPNLQQLLSSTPSTSQIQTPAPAATPQPAPRKRPPRSKKPAASAKKAAEQPKQVEAKMEATDAMEITSIMSELARLDQLESQGIDVTDQRTTLTEKRNMILLKMVGGTGLGAGLDLSGLSQTQPRRAPLQPVTQRPIREPASQNLFEPSYETKSQPQLIHSSHPSTSFESSQPPQIYPQSSSNFSSNSTVLHSVQYASTSQINSQPSYQPVQVASGIGASGLYSTSNVVNTLSSQPGGAVASCIITQQQLEQQRLLAPKPASTPIKYNAAPVATAPQSRVSPTPVMKMLSKQETALRIAQSKESRTRRISRYFDYFENTVGTADSDYVNTNFKNVSDICKRLLPYSVFYEPDPSQTTLDNFDHELLRINVHHRDQKRRLEKRLNAFFIKEATKPIDNDLVMLLSLDKEYETRKLAEEKEATKNEPEIFASTSDFIPFANQLKQEIEEKTENLNERTDKEELEKFRAAIYDYNEFSEAKPSRSSSPTSLFARADYEESRMLRWFNRKRSRKDLKKMKQKYRYAIAESFKQSYKKPYSEVVEAPVSDNPSTPSSIKKERTPTIMSPPSVMDKNTATVFSPAAHTRLATPVRQLTPQPTSQVLLPPQPLSPPLQPTPVVISPQPLKTKFSAPPVKEEFKSEVRSTAMPLKSKLLKRYNEQKEVVPPMKIARFMAAAASTSFPIPPSQIETPENVPEEQKVEPLKINRNVSTFKKSLNGPLEPCDTINRTGPTEIEERSGKKKRKEKDKKKKHKERDKEKKAKEKALVPDAVPISALGLIAPPVPMLSPVPVGEVKPVVEKEKKVMLKLCLKGHQLKREASVPSELQEEVTKETKLCGKPSKDKERKEKKSKEGKDKSKHKHKEGKEKTKEGKKKSKSKDKESKKERKKKRKAEKAAAALQDASAQNDLEFVPSIFVPAPAPAPEPEHEAPAPVSPLVVKLRLPRLRAEPEPAKPVVAEPEPCPASTSNAPAERSNGSMPIKIRLKKNQPTKDTENEAPSIPPVLLAPPPETHDEVNKEEKKERKEKKDGEGKHKDKKKKDKKEKQIKVKIKPVPEPPPVVAPAEVQEAASLEAFVPQENKEGSKKERHKEKKERKKEKFKEKEKSKKEKKEKKRHLEEKPAVVPLPPAPVSIPEPSVIVSAPLELKRELDPELSTFSAPPAASQPRAHFAEPEPIAATTHSFADLHSSPFVAQEPPITEQDPPPPRCRKPLPNRSSEKLEEMRAPPQMPTYPMMGMDANDASTLASWNAAVNMSNAMNMSQALGLGNPFNMATSLGMDNLNMANAYNMVNPMSAQAMSAALEMGAALNNMGAMNIGVQHPVSMAAAHQLNMGHALNMNPQLNMNTMNTMNAALGMNLGIRHPFIVSPNNSDDEEAEASLRHRTDDLISRLAAACAQNSS